MNSSACDRISSSASARSFAAAVTRSPSSTCTFAALLGQSTGKAPTQFGHHCTTVVGSMVCQFDAANSISASQEYHSADQLRDGKRAMSAMIFKSPTVSPGVALGPVSGVVTNGRFTRSAKYQPELVLVALPPPPELAALPSLPSLPSKLPDMICLP